MNKEQDAILSRLDKAIGSIRQTRKLDPKKTRLAIELLKEGLEEYLEDDLPINGNGTIPASG